MRSSKLMPVAAGLAGLTMLVAACGGGGSDDSSDSAADGGSSGQCGTDPMQVSGKVGVILQSTSASGRWEAQDRPRLLKNIAQYAPKAEVIYSNGEGKAENQLNQAEAAMSAGATVLLVAPVDGVAAGEIARRAKQSDVKFIAYDAPVMNAPVDYYVSFDNNKVGGLMGEYIKENTKDGDTVVFISGAPQDDNAARFQQGALDVLQPLFDDGTRKLGYKTFTPNWDLNNAQREMEQALSALNDNVQGVVAANDNLATGAIQALKTSGLAGKVPVTGQDATATGIGQIVSGTQGMTVYKPIEGEAKAAGQLVSCLLADQEPPAGLINGEVENGGSKKVPSVLLEPIKVTKDNIEETVVKDQFVTWDDICKGVSVTCPPK
jgi:D-xylose transport system substrate-binding protein